MDIREKMKLFYDNPVTSWHEHVSALSGNPDKLNIGHCDAQLEIAAMFGVDKLVTSMPIASDKHCPPEKFIQANEVVRQATELHPGKIFGMAFVNPGFIRETLTEVERCVKHYGFVGVKLYHQYFMDDPTMFPLIEKCIELDVPILMHCAKAMDATTCMRQPRLSNGVHMANVARRYPEATFIMAHIGGGGDWQWAIKAISDCKNVFADIGGSIHDRPLIEESVRYLGADRLLFATDGCWSSAVTKVLGADISDEDKKTILEGRAFNKYLGRAGK